MAYNRKPRPYGLDKRTLVKICFLSLVDALSALEHEIHVVGDRLSGDLLSFFSRFPVKVSNQELDNGRSIREAVRIALEAPDDEWVYFCEDDYLHVPETFERVDDLIENRDRYLAYKPKPRWRRLLVDELEKKPLCIFLADYPDQYRPKYRWPSFLFYSRFCHWYQVLRTTGSFVAQSGYLKRKQRALAAFARTCDDRSLSRQLYAGILFHDRALCVSPIPALASHMHEGTMSVLGDWDHWVATYLERLAQGGFDQPLAPGASAEKSSPESGTDHS